MTRPRTQRGFTLIELTLVLFVVALSAHLAVRELSRQRVRRLRDAADRQLSEISSAILSADGTSGFLSDMGRLPAACPMDPGDENTPLSLRELWSRPDGLGEYRARPATPENLADGAPSAIADPDILVPCGWGGPYLRLPPAATRLRDPWGNAIETPDSAGLPRLFADPDASTPADASDVSIAAIRHYGSDGLPDDERPPETDDQSDTTLAFVVPEARLLLTFEPDTLEQIHWYAPLGDKITGDICIPEPGTSQLLIEGLTPGTRFLKIYSVDAAPRVLQVTLRPGRDTALEL